jgi:hypothetical protein
LFRTHVELLALEDVAVGATRLTGARGDNGEQSAGLELRLEEGVDLGLLLALVEDSLDVVRLLLVRGLLGEFGATEHGLGVLKDVSNR